MEIVRDFVARPRHCEWLTMLLLRCPGLSCITFSGLSCRRCFRDRNDVDNLCAIDGFRGLREEGCLRERRNVRTRRENVVFVRVGTRSLGATSTPLDWMRDESRTATLTTALVDRRGRFVVDTATAAVVVVVVMSACRPAVPPSSIFFFVILALATATGGSFSPARALLLVFMVVFRVWVAKPCSACRVRPILVAVCEDPSCWYGRSVSAVTKRLYDAQ
jgi:hypothetical protein